MEQFRAAVLVFGTLIIIFVLGIRSLSPENVDRVLDRYVEKERHRARLTQLYEQSRDYSDLEKFPQRVAGGMKTLQEDEGVRSFVRSADEKLEYYWEVAKATSVSLMHQAREKADWLYDHLKRRIRDYGLSDETGVPEDSEYSAIVNPSNSPEASSIEKRKKTRWVKRRKSTERRRGDQDEVTKTVMEKFGGIQEVLKDPEFRERRKNRFRAETDFYVSDELLNSRDMAEFKESRAFDLTDEFYNEADGRAENRDE